MPKTLPRINVDPQILLGKPVIRGTRIPVYVIVGLIAEGQTVQYVLENYPDLTPEDISQALQFATEATKLTSDLYA